MDVEDVKILLNELTDEQLNQIISIVEEIIENFPETAETFVEINSKRDIYWLNDELNLLERFLTIQLRRCEKHVDRGINLRTR